MKNKEILEKFKTWLIVNEYSKNTILHYYTGIKKFLSKVDINNINENTINNYFLELQDKYAKKTIHCYKDSIQTFLKFLKKDIKLPKRSKLNKKIPQYITLKFFEKELIPMVELISQKPLRDRALLYFLFFTGLRKSEIINLKREDFNLEERSVKVYISKTKEERIVFYTKKVRDLLKMYFSTEIETKNAFNINNNTISYLLKKLNLYFKDINLHCHLFRDSYSVHLLMQGIDISIVSELLGHHSIQSTMRYTRLRTEDLKKKYDKFIK